MPSPFGIIHNQLIIRANPDDDEEEGDEIRATADAWAPRIEDELQGQWRHLTDGQPDAAELRRRLGEMPPGTLREALEQMLQESSSLGVQAAVRGLEHVGIGFNWRLSNAAAAEWARNYSYDLIRGIDEVTQRRVADALSGWIESGGTWNDLVNRMEPWFGRVRAERIATTEATRAYAEGTFDGYERAGFGPRPPAENRPPAHVNCRCWVGLQQEHDGSWSYIWFTARDELVCPICQPKHLSVIGPAGTI